MTHILLFLIQRRRLRVNGIVQGVGFRPFVYGLASELNISGAVGNDSLGVWCEVQGSIEEIDDFLQRLRTAAPPLADVQSVEISYLDPITEEGFRIVKSQVGGRSLTSMPIDASICVACLAEVDDPLNRRYGYAFTCCTNCGPRYTVVEHLPYDRDRTSMHKFPLCPLCQKEYDTPTDRRFHAQAICCPQCGPQLDLCDGNGMRIHGDQITMAASALRDGKILAIKGLGGFQLLVRADCDSAVDRLRKRKHRDDKPFAVLCADVQMALTLGAINDIEVRALTSPSTPVVLVARVERTPLADGVAPGSSLIGLLMPTTALHHLISRASGVPLVCTSGNFSDDPIIIDDDQQLLRDIADLSLTHNRDIVRRADDSVGRVMDGRFTLMRRARGFAPQPLWLDGDGPSVLGVGGQLKNTVCLVTGRRAFTSVHIGDLETIESHYAFESAVKDALMFHDHSPELVVCDMHPEYRSTMFARSQEIAPFMAVQHHHAHVAACRAENHCQDPVLGIAFDGFGWGVDGTAWGGEFLVVDDVSFVRVGHLATMSMPGGVRAIKEPWRMAVALLTHAFNGAPPTNLDVIARHVDDWSNVAAITNANSTLRTSAVGRLLEGLASIVIGLDYNSFEGQVAMRFEQVATTDDKPYEFDLIEIDGIVTIDPAGVIRRVVEDLGMGVQPGVISTRVHIALADLNLDVARRVREIHGITVVALTGGVFQNKLLLESTATRLRNAGFTVLRHGQVPANDGGISLGQAIIGRNRLRADMPLDAGIHSR